MGSNGLAADEWANWLTPKDAVAKICDAIKSENASKNAIIERLIGSQIHAKARTVVIDNGTASQNNFEIKPEIWNRIDRAFNVHSDWWKTGDVSVPLTVNAQTATMRLFAIRLNPQDVDRMLKDLGFKTETKQEIEYSEITPQKRVAMSPKRDISPAHFEAWWTFYQAVIEPNKDTEPYAIAHFERCFPEHKVSRDKIRNKRGPSKSGPRPKTAE